MDTPFSRTTPLPGRDPIDIRFLKRRIEAAHDTKTAHDTAKAALVSYIGQYAPMSCEAETAFTRCVRAVDGILLVSCGHYAYLCGEHLTIAFRDSRAAAEVTCTRVLPDLHARPVHGVTVEWAGLA